ncbi:glucan biosynthesis protein [Sessilibacter corallicola]|uniref:glucan biosynthesis protein n=1 Tax=Sessilibacter corallicola TaxID=2904075 RepID=UPI001E5031AB|nr:glucan biosynthesis protein G [Sessilibacter corallicola]MCE2027296.1 glucan biosynthesis protein G [Sessilibacter corallicola]
MLGYFWSAFAVSQVPEGTVIEEQIPESNSNNENLNEEGHHTYSENRLPESNDKLFQWVSEKAKALSKAAYKENKSELPQTLDNLSYQQYRSIRFNPNAALWKNESEFEIQLFHPGFLYKKLISLNLIDKPQTHARLKFNSNDFIYEREATHIPNELNVDSVTDKMLGYAGFRVHYPLNSNIYKDELIVFQGASYFRMVGPQQTYGISGRGLAIDTGEPEGEEFPYFVEFWLKQPTENEHSLVVFALLDSPSVSGAFQFLIKPGIHSEIDVNSKLYPRKNIKKLGVAPLTSMFLYGENKTKFVDDFRPEIHDSDGLQILLASGEWLWRPLRNPQELSITSSTIEHLKGFGLAQRDRAFDNYSDLEAKYETRPSLWIKPMSDWGEGRVELVEIPTNSETNDNIVAYWVPSKPVLAGDELSFDYRISTYNANAPGFDAAFVKSTRTSWAAIAGESNPPPKSHRQFVIDFAGIEIDRLSANANIKVNLILSSGEYENLRVVKLPEGKGWRVYFTLIPSDNTVIDMRLNLSLHDQRISETWNYVWNSNAIQ